MLMGQSDCSDGGEPDLSAYEREKPGGVGGLLGPGVSSSGGVDSSGSNAVSSLGVGVLIGGSTLGVNDGALSLEVGVMVPPSHI